MTSTPRPHRLHAILVTLLINTGLSTQAAEKSETPRNVVRKIVGDGPDRSSWTIRDEQKVCALAKSVLGMAEGSRQPVSADVVIFDRINIPFLHEKIVNRPVWRVTVRDFVFELESSPADLKDMQTRILDTFLDPRTGQVLRVRTRLPAGLPKELREASPEFAELQMYSGIKEKYHGFPAEPPEMSFVDAVDAVQKAGWSPLASAQVTGEWIIRSTFDTKPQPVWVITLQGMPPLEASYPGVPVDARNHIRVIIDPVSREWIQGGTTPQPE